jgi:hypothetical protein
MKILKIRSSHKDVIFTVTEQVDAAVVIFIAFARCSIRTSAGGPVILAQISVILFSSYRYMLKQYLQ